MYLSDGTKNTPRVKTQHFRPAQQGDVDLATNLNCIRLDYHGEDHGQFLSMDIFDGNLLVTMAFNLIELGDPCVPFQALEKPVPRTFAIPQIRKDRAFPAWHGNQDWPHCQHVLGRLHRFELKH